MYKAPTREVWKRLPWFVKLHVVLVVAGAVAMVWLWRAGLLAGRLLPLLLIVAGLSLTSCAADPRNEADADRTRIMAAEEAADRQQARELAQARAALDLAEQERISAARGSARIFAAQVIAVAGGVAGALALMGAAGGVVLATVGAGRAAAHGAMVRAGLIPLSDATRQFPLVLHYAGRGRFTLANPNTGAVALLDTRAEADREQVRRSAAVELAGAVAHEARLSSEPSAFVIPQEVER